MKRSVFTVAKRLALAFAVVIAVLLGVGSAALYSASRLAEAERWNTHTYRVLDAAGDLLSAMVNMETGSRGYLIAGDDSFLEPWTAGRQAFRKSWDRLKDLTADNPEQQARLAAMMDRHVAFVAVAERMQALRRSGASGTQVSEEFRLGKDKAAMDGFRKLQAEFDGAERALLVTRGKAADDMRANERVTVIGGMALAVLAAVVLSLWVTRSILGELGGEPGDATQAVRRIADGDLTRPITPACGRDSSLLAALADMQSRLVGVVGDIRSGSDSVANAASQITAGNQDLSARTETQASNLQQTAASMTQVTTTVKENAASAARASDLAKGATAAAESGSCVVGEVVTTMDRISASSRKIGDIINVIDNIAFQTNLLSLNAAVEAAKAAEHGRGFSVVASEVRTLAHRCSDAAKDIRGLIRESNESVDSGASLVKQAGETMQGVVDRVREVNAFIAQISAASTEQTEGLARINEAVSTLDEATQQNAALVEESAAAATSLHQQAQKLVEAVQAFKVPGGSAGRPAHAVA